MTVRAKGAAVLLIAAMLAATAWAQEVPVKPNGLVALLTDYGTDSIYVGILKGAMYAKNPAVKVDSITNDVPPFDVVAGAFLLAEGCQTWPKGTVFCCVVDPGVGTSRKPMALATRNGWYFVGPDNGLTTLVVERYGLVEARECTNPDLWRVGEVSTTFHGRDIFGPVAAALASGTALADVGKKLENIVRLDLPKSRVEGDAVHGEVMRVDPYGNIVTNVRREDLEKLGIAKGEGVDITVGAQHYSAPYVTTYGEVPPGDRLVVIQSSGFVELAANMNNLAQILGEGLHASVVLKKAESAR